MAVPRVFAMYGYDHLSPYFPGGGSAGDMGIVEGLWRMTQEDQMTPLLMESFAIAPDGMKFVMRIKKGIRFNSPADTATDFGELTAEDVAWKYNITNATTNPKSTAVGAGNLAAIFKEARVVDKYTLEIDAAEKANSVLGIIQYGNQSGVSKKAAETMGDAWAKNHVVGTGPFIQKEWLTGVRGVVEATPTHWRKAARIKTFEIVEIPEASAQVAALKSGQINAAYVDFKVVRDLVTAGFVFLNGAGGDTSDNISAIMGGNYWEEKNARTGEPLNPWKGPAYAKDYPWVGNPWGDKVPYQDTDNPAGMDDMEQARLVRWALSYAIDRDLIVKEILGGMGGPIYIEYISPTSQTGGWDPKWKIPFDPAKAKDLLAKAGYPNGFDMTINSYAAEIGPVALEIADAVTTMWRNIGVKATQERLDYGSVVAPRMIKREQVWPVFKNCDVFCNFYPLDWPFPATETSYTRPGWGCSIEIPYLADMTMKIRREPDREKRIGMHREVIQFMWDQALIVGIIERPNGVVASPKKIKSWDSDIVYNSPWHYPQDIVPVD